MISLLKLTDLKGQTVLIGIESIINVKLDVFKRIDSEYTTTFVHCTKIQSRGAMVETTWVKETPEEIYKMYNSKQQKS